MAPDYDHLTLMEKVEVFEHAVNNTAGDDLAKLLWLKSPSSEVRLDFSTIYSADWLYSNFSTSFLTFDCLGGKMSRVLTYQKDNIQMNIFPFSRGWRFTDRPAVILERKEETQ